jgi:hypothetical protein
VTATFELDASGQPASRPLLAYDYVLRLRDLRNPPIEFTERVPLARRHSWSHDEQAAQAATARLRLANTAAQLRADSGYLYDAEDVRSFAAKILSVEHSTESQSITHGGLGLTFVATLELAEGG